MAQLMCSQHRKEFLERTEADSAQGRVGPVDLAAINSIKADALGLKVKSIEYIGESSLLACSCFQLAFRFSMCWDDTFYGVCGCAIAADEECCLAF